VNHFAKKEATMKTMTGAESNLVKRLARGAVMNAAELLRGIVAWHDTPSDAPFSTFMLGWIAPERVPAAVLSAFANTAADLVPENNPKSLSLVERARLIRFAAQRADPKALCVALGYWHACLADVSFSTYLANVLASQTIVSPELAEHFPLQGPTRVRREHSEWNTA
jgi:hypothetical protein